MNPIQNSNPAKDNRKKDVDVKIKSSLIVPTITVQQYRITHTTSEYIIKVIRFLELNKNIEDDDQNKKVRKLIQVKTKLIQ